MKKVLSLVAAVVLLASCAHENVNESNARLIEAYEKYFVTTECLLDSIYMHDPDWYDDVLSEQDVRVNHVEAQIALDSLRARK